MIQGIWNLVEMVIDDRNQAVSAKIFSDRSIHEPSSLIENGEPEFTKEIFSSHGKND